MTRESLLRIPLFYKLTLANAAVVVLAVVLSQLLLVRAVPGTGVGDLTGILAGSVAIAVALGILVNAAVVGVALRPLRRLEETARVVSAGDLSARTGTSSLADPDLEELMVCFDQMLDSVQRNRKYERGLAYRLVESEERTRRRIARDLYDDTAQRLAAVLLYAPRIRSLGNGADPDRIADRLREDLTEVLEGVRATARRLRPPELDELGVTAALRAEARLAGERSGVTVEVERTGDLPYLSRPAAVTLFRLVQEVLGGLDPDDGTRAVRIRLGVVGRAVECTIEDGGEDPGDAWLRGRGAAPERIDEMNERASWIGGAVSLDAGDGGGTAVRIRVPADSPVREASRELTPIGGVA